MPFEVVKEQCNMESGDTGQAMIYKLEGDERIPFACHADEASAYAVIAAIEESEANDKNIDELFQKMEKLVDEEDEDENDEDVATTDEDVVEEDAEIDEDGAETDENQEDVVEKDTIEEPSDENPEEEVVEDQPVDEEMVEEEVVEEELDAVEENIEAENDETVEQMLDETSKEYAIGDMVGFTDEDTEYVGVVENIDEEADVYTVRVYARAGEEFEPTDMLYNLSLDDIYQMQTEEQTDLMTDKEDIEKEMLDNVSKNNGRIMAKMREIKMQVIEGDDDMKIGVIEGYASTYGNTDLGGDVVEKGAFTQTLKHKNNTVPLLLDHGYKTIDIAGIAYLQDDQKGLYLKAEMPLDIPEVANAYKKTKFMIERGGKMGLSIGYDTIKSLPGSDGTRRLKELALHEVSITPFPMNTEAQIMAAKASKSAAQPKPKDVTRRKAVTLLQDEEFSLLVNEIKQIITSFKES